MRPDQEKLWALIIIHPQLHLPVYSININSHLSLPLSSRCYLDMAKVLVFRHMFWFVLSVVFVTGATRISVFGLGYLLACFFFLLFGTKLLRKPSRTRLVMWDCLIIYNVAVIISKNMLSVSGYAPRRGQPHTVIIRLYRVEINLVR